MPPEDKGVLLQLQGRHGVLPRHRNHPRRASQGDVPRRPAWSRDPRPSTWKCLRSPGRLGVHRAGLDLAARQRGLLPLRPLDFDSLGGPLAPLHPLLGVVEVAGTTVQAGVPAPPQPRLVADWALRRRPEDAALGNALHELLLPAGLRQTVPREERGELGHVLFRELLLVALEGGELLLRETACGLRRLLRGWLLIRAQPSLAPGLQGALPAPLFRLGRVRCQRCRGRLRRLGEEAPAVGEEGRDLLLVFGLQGPEACARVRCLEVLGEPLRALHLREALEVVPAHALHHVGHLGGVLGVNLQLGTDPQRVLGDLLLAHLACGPVALGVLQLEVHA
mmetsp:Transcript_117967/g.334550  ORF Transcript_117967/g.334550 Transcript_117967/m.334550 type:complete len:336 (+) Transcript_117967:125-1132(+)